MKRGVVVPVGQIWRDCDKRMYNRKRVVVEIEYEKEKVRMGTSLDDSGGTWISVRHMYPHSTGWELVSEP